MDMKLIFKPETSDRMYAYWADEGFGWAVSPTADFFAREIDRGNIEFWTVQTTDGRIVGELHLVHALSDRDFADGESRCYLCDFRVTETLRGQGIGSQLLTRVLERAIECGYREATIGVFEEEEQNVRLYRRFGFKTLIKTTEYDPCNLTADGKFVPDHFWLLSKPLYTENF